MPAIYKSLRYTTAIAVSLVALSNANQANAQCTPLTGTPLDDTVTCSGSSTAINLMGGNDTLTNDGDITGDINLANGDDTVTNAGTITGRVLVTGGSDTITNSATGVIENLNSGGDNTQSAIRITGGDLNGGLDNDGRITAVKFPAIKVDGTDVTGVIDNSGLIEGTEPLASGGGIVVQGAGSDISGGIINRAVGAFAGTPKGTITGTLTAIDVAQGGDISGGVTNAGLIEATGSGGFSSFAGIGLSSGADISGGVTNQNGGVISGARGIGVTFSNMSGTITNESGGNITGDIGINVSSSSDVSGGITNQVGGVITGEAAGINVTFFSNISGVINNSGTISGTDSTGTGILVEGSSDISGGITNNAGGIITGMREGILVGTSTDLTGAVTNSGTISGGRGGIYLGGSSVDIFGGVTNNAGGVITGDIGIYVSSSSAISGGISNSGTIEGTTGTAIDLQGLSAATPITIAGGRIIGDVTDGNIGAGSSPVTVSGSGFKTEGDFTVSDLVVNAGQDFTIGSDNIVELNDMSTSAGIIKFELADASVARVNVTGAGNDVQLTADNVEAVNIDRNYTIGEAILIATGMDTVNAGAGLTLADVSNNLLFFDLQVADGLSAGVGADTDVYLIVSAENDPCSGFTNNPNGACKVLGDLTGPINADLLSIINNADEEILKATLPEVNGASLSAAQNVTSNTIRLVSDRLTVIRDGARGASGISSGNITENLQIWGQVYGQKSDQGERKGIAGFDAITRGVTVGADTEEVHDDATVGVALSYANTDVRSNNVTNTRSDINSYNITLYGDYDLEDDTYLIGDIGYTYGDNATTRFNVGGIGDNARSDYGSHQVQLRGIIAKDYFPEEYEGVKVTPKAQVRYTHYQNEDIEETGAGGANLDVDSEALNILEFGVGVDVRKDFVQQNGGVLSPEVSVGYRYDLIGDAVQTTSTFEGGGNSFRTEGTDPDQDTLNVGFGVGYTTPSNIEFTVSYDYENKDEFDSHSAFIRLAAPF